MGCGEFLTEYSIYFSESISDAVVLNFFFLSLLFAQPRQNAAEEKMDRK